jgi:beta-N-acetylhexosaminidase
MIQSPMMQATAKELAARLVCVGIDGTTLSSSAKELVGRGVGFVVLFARNVQTPRQVSELIAAVKSAAPKSVGLCVDQEGGRVRRLREGFTHVPSMRDVGHAAMRSEESNDTTAYDVGEILGTECRAVGFDVDFGPVLDTDTNPLNPVIADRSLSRDANVVAHLGCDIIDGMQNGLGALAACGKHFPGHGDTSQDSHYALPRLDHDLQRLHEVELVPFVAAARAGVASMMTSHIVFSPLDDELPATLSKTVLTGLLRDEIGYDGVVFTDDMEMKAIANNFDFDEAVIGTIEAGADVVTICHTPEKQHRAIDLLAAAIDSGRLSRERVADSIRRIDRLHAAYVRPVEFKPDVLDCAAHRGVIARIEPAGVEQLDPTQYRV